MWYNPVSYKPLEVCMNGLAICNCPHNELRTNALHEDTQVLLKNSYLCSCLWGSIDLVYSGLLRSDSVSWYPGIRSLSPSLCCTVEMWPPSWVLRPGESFWVFLEAREVMLVERYYLLGSSFYLSIHSQSCEVLNMDLGFQWGILGGISVTRGQWAWYSNNPSHLLWWT